MTPKDLDILIYAGVCREEFEPATACRVGAEIGLNPDATVYDLSNACLGVLNGIVEIANRIELGQCRAGLVVSCETAREINEAMIDQMVQTQSMEVFKNALATLTGGSVQWRCWWSTKNSRRNIADNSWAGSSRTPSQHHGLCRWGFEVADPFHDRAFHQYPGGFLVRSAYNLGMKHCVMPFMSTDAGSVLKYGVDLGLRTVESLPDEIGWAVDQLDKVICHQVGSSHRETMLKMLGVPDREGFLHL